MPIQDQQLIIEPKFPYAEGLSRINAKDDEPLPEGVSARNSWWSRRLRMDIVIWNEGGKVLWGCVPRTSRVDMELDVLGCSDVWGIEQEANAVNLLATLISHRQFKQYMLTGMFLETSKRSRLTYLFRRLRPTIVIKNNDPDPRVLAALCAHPIGYYAGTFAGVMCPTDDVVAHLTMMRGDERLYWRRCNQHSPDRPEAGL